MENQATNQAEAVLQRLTTLNDRLDAQLATALSRQGLSPAVQARLPLLGQALDPVLVNKVLEAFEPQLPRFGQSYEELQRPSTAQLASRFGTGLLRC